MNTQYELKREYTAPLIERVQLDNEISLSLESPPLGPGESINSIPEYFNNDPFKTNIA
jgi:hypothetical protein